MKNFNNFFCSNNYLILKKRKEKWKYHTGQNTF